MADDLTRYDQKLEYILRTSARIFAEKGYHSTSMRDISRATNVSLAGLYHYCRSKDELLFLIQDNCFQRVLESAHRRIVEVSDPVEKLRIFIDNHLSFFAANMAEMKVLSHEADSLTGEMAERVSDTKRQYTFLARDILAELQRAEAVSGQPVDLTVATYALFGMMNWIYNWYDPAGKLTVAELVGNLARLFITGFASGKVSSDMTLGSIHRDESLSVWRISDIES
jgi:AcrR family transcriptional regulator